jgi:hypothetical protein
MTPHFQRQFSPASRGTSPDSQNTLKPNGVVRQLLSPNKTMAPTTPSSSTAALALIEAKELLRQHYILFIVGVVFARLFYLRYLSPYRDIPGPFLATISPLWRLRGALNGTLHKDITEGHKQYGTIFRISPDEVSISDPEAIKTIYAHGAGSIKVCNFGYARSNRRRTFTAYGAHILHGVVYSLIPTKPPTPPNAVSSQMRTPSPPSSRWNPTSTARSRKCVPACAALPINPSQSTWPFGCKLMPLTSSASSPLVVRLDF